jgi:uncharacterized membrane protein
LSFYEFLLLLHVLAAFALVAALVLFWTMTVVGLTGAAGGAELFATLARPANLLVGAGAIFTLVFGVWLAIYVDGYELWDGWILASLVLWAVGGGTGERAGRKLGTPDAFADRTRRRQGILLQVVATAAFLGVLVLMIFKPGA